jgi:hypothetical protein
MEIVHSFRVYNIGQAAMVIQPHKCTVECIQRIRGAIVPETAEMVDASFIDEDGRYRPTLHGTKN